MAALLSSSRRALLSPTTAVLLDVLAPTVYASLRTASSQATDRPETRQAAAPSTSKVQLDDPPSSKPSRRQKQRSKAAKDPEQPTAHRSPRGKPPSAKPPSAVDLLSKIRNTSASAPSTDPAVQRHNESVLNIVNGTRDPRRDFDLAFTKGWLPIRATGQVGRLRPKDLAKVLRTCALAAREQGLRPGTGYEWKEVRELALWLAGDKEMPGLVDWAWSMVELGRDGCEQVVDVWESISRGEHLELRSGDKAINWAYQPKLEFASTARSASKPPVFLFAAYIAAKSVAERYAASRTPFATLLPTFLDPWCPLLHRWLNHSDAETWLNRALSSSGHASDPSALSSAVAWIRQVSLAQIWYEHPVVPGLALVRHVRAAFQRGSHPQILELWWSIREAIDNPDFSWISTAGWEASGNQDGLNVDVEDSGDGAEAARPDGASNGDTSAKASGSRDVDAITRRSDPPKPAESFASSRPALTQAIVSPFLTGFVRAQLLEQANEIWSWLVSHDPPLVPGAVAWTGLISGYAQRGDVDSVENAWSDMVRSGVVPNLRAWLVRMDAYFSAKRTDDAIRLSRTMLADKAVAQEVASKHGGRVPEVVWDKSINGLLASGRRAEAEDVLADMDAAGSPPTIRTVNLFLKYYSRGTKPDISSIVRMLKLVSDRDLVPDAYTFTTVLVALLAGGQQDATTKTIQIMESSRVKPTIATYGAIINSLASSAKPEHLGAAVQLLDEIETRKMETNEIIYTSIIQGFLRAISANPLPSTASTELDDGQHPYLVAALTLKTRMERRGIPLNRVGYNAILSAALALKTDYGVELALKLFKEMKRRPGLFAGRAAAAGGSGGSNASPDLNDGIDSTARREGGTVTVSDTWLVLLEGFVIMKDWARARAVVREMERSGFEVRNRGLRRLVDLVTGGTLGARN
ncbi:hypothetical protein JCM10212_000474 [Sporobolomyces blumeae]